MFALLLALASAIADDSNITWVPKKISGLDYPILAAQARIEGQVIIDLTLSRDGTVEHSVVLSGTPVLAEAAKTNIELWRFRTVCTKGVPGGHVIVTYTFTLQGSADTRARARFFYEDPFNVIVIGEALNVMPQRQRHKIK